MNDPIKLPAAEGTSNSPAPVMTPREIVRELDRYIVGQREAKRAVAIALRNRYRRLALPQDLQAEITPKNILMIEIELEPEEGYSSVFEFVSGIGSDEVGDGLGDLLSTIPSGRRRARQVS